MSSFTITDETAGVLYRQWGPGFATYGHGWSYEIDGDTDQPAGYIYLTTQDAVVCVHEGPTGDPISDPLIYTIDTVNDDDFITLHPSTGSDDGAATVFLYRGPTGSGFDEAVVHFEVDLQPGRTL